MGTLMSAAAAHAELQEYTSTITNGAIPLRDAARARAALLYHDLRRDPSLRSRRAAAYALG